ncbi:MAG: bifunctional riboflavin kinase/FAD synthetase [bacterium]|nr:bifunctional riboflavin kinase/FAD synthetase [bacterium]
MRIFESLDHLPDFKPTVFTQGTFDGVHLGHQKILLQVKQATETIGGESVLLTFWPHPRLLLFPEDNDLKLLQTLDEKLEVIEQCGIDNVVVVPFTKSFSNILPEDYIKHFLVNELNIQIAIIGYDHRFGRNREGDINLLVANATKFNYKVQEIHAEDLNHITISSTKIRTALAEGDVKTANQYLGRPYNFHGRVVHGRKLGRTLGYPTANLEIEDLFKLVPAKGVYAVKVLINRQKYIGMLNIGDNPTVPEKKFSIEVNIFDFNAEIYGEIVEIQLIERMRDELKFENLDVLVQNLHADKLNALSILQSL